MGLEKLYVTICLSMFGPVVASQLPDDLGRTNAQRKTRPKRRMATFFFLGNRAEISHMTREIKFALLTKPPRLLCSGPKCPAPRGFLLFFLQTKTEPRNDNRRRQRAAAFFSRSVAHLFSPLRGSILFKKK